MDGVNTMVFKVIFEMVDGPDIVLMRTSNEVAAREKANRLRRNIHLAGGKSQVRIVVEDAR